MHRNPPLGALKHPSELLACHSEEVEVSDPIGPIDDCIDDVVGNLPVDGGSGGASVDLPDPAAKAAADLMKRTRSRPDHDVTTGADLGAGPGAGRMSGEDLGGAEDIAEATRQAQAV